MNLLKNECGANIERFYNLTPTIYIYDIDGTIVNSSHRHLSNADGSINLDAWRENSTKDKIQHDDLMPLSYQCNQHYKNGNMVVLCTADVIPVGGARYQWLISNGILFDRLISRPVDCMTVDFVLKQNQLAYLYRLKHYAKCDKVIYDDNTNNLMAIAELGKKYNQPTYCYEPYENGALYRAY
jgi:hypothetical protein